MVQQQEGFRTRSLFFPTRETKVLEENLPPTTKDGGRPPEPAEGQAP